MSKVVWESPEKNHLGQSYLTVKSNNGYLYSERAGVDSVAFILYDPREDRLCALAERKPPLDERFDERVFLTAAFGGSLDIDKEPIDIVVEEVREEAGFTVTTGDILPLGNVFVSTQSNQFCHLYLVYVNRDRQHERDPQTAMEAESELVWFDKDNSHNYDDWKIMSIVHRARAIGHL